MGNRTLKGYLARFILAEFLFTLCLIGIFFIWTVISINIGFVNPADYPEKQLTRMEQKITAESVAASDFPNIYEVQIEDKQGNVVASTIPKNSRTALEEARAAGTSGKNQLFTAKKFVYYEGKHQNVFLSYSLLADFASPTLRKLLPNEELLADISFLLLWVMGFLLLIRYYATKIQKELVKLLQMNEQIRQMNLDFEPPKSNIKEFQELITSISLMKTELSISLKQQWTAKQQQEKALQAITHDIRTPITLISGNLELLEESSLSEEQTDLTKGVEKGVIRLNHYVDELKKVSGIPMPSEKKAPITEAYINELISLTKDIALAHKLNVKILAKDTSAILIHQAKVMEAFQNVVLNAAEFSPANSSLTLSFTASAETFTITIIDAGPGFDQKNLSKALDEFYTSRESRGEGHYGLGLSIADNIMKQNNGKLVLSNVIENDSIVGGKVALVFAMTSHSA